MTITGLQAYRKGWDASRRTITCDLEAAERRFLVKWGESHHDDFVRGWCDYAAGKDYDAENLAEHPVDEDEGYVDDEESLDDLGVYVVVGEERTAPLDLVVPFAEVYRDATSAEIRADEMSRRFLVTRVRVLTA